MKYELWSTCKYQSLHGGVYMPVHLLVGTYTSYEDFSKAVKYRHDQLSPESREDDKYYVKVYE